MGTPKTPEVPEQDDRDTVEVYRGLLQPVAECRDNLLQGILRIEGVNDELKEELNALTLDQLIERINLRIAQLDSKSKVETPALTTPDAETEKRLTESEIIDDVALRIAAARHSRHSRPPEPSLFQSQWAKEQWEINLPTALERARQQRLLLVTKG